jgi:hypothetical protein
VVPVLIFGELFHTKGEIVNLSRSGCVIAVAQAPEKGQELHLLVQIPNRDTSIEIQVAMVKWNALGLFGVEFVRVNTPHQISLQHYLSMMDSCPLLGKLVHPDGSAEVAHPRRQVVA